MGGRSKYRCQAELTSMRTGCPVFLVTLKSSWILVLKRLQMRSSTQQYLKSVLPALTDKQDLLETDKLFLPKRENICPFKSTDISLKKRTQLSVVCSFMYGRRGNQPLKKDSERQSSLKNTFASGTSCRLTKTQIFCIEENNWCCQVNSDL